MNIGLLRVLVCGLFFLDIQTDVKADKAPELLTVATWNLEWFFDDFKANNRSYVAKEQSAPSREEFRK